MLSFEATKLASLLVYPLSQALLLIVLGLVLRAVGARRLATVFTVIAVVWLYMSSTGFVADRLMASLESGYPARSVPKIERADAIVGLGGATRGATHGNRLGDMSGQGDRLLHAMSLYKAGKAPVIVVSGGSRAWEAPEAVLMSEILQAMGVSETSIIEERVSRNTLENARLTADVLQKHRLDTVLLVTSAFHMRRAEAMFRLQGVNVIPSATDYQIVNSPPVVPVWLPTVDDLQRSTYAIREYVAFLVYWAGL